MYTEYKAMYLTPFKAFLQCCDGKTICSIMCLLYNATKSLKAQTAPTNPPGAHLIIQCGVSVCLPPRSLAICFLLWLRTELTVWTGSALCSAEVRKTLAGFSRACNPETGLTSRHVVVCPHYFMQSRSTPSLVVEMMGARQWASWMLAFANHPTFHKEAGTRAARWRCESQDGERCRLRKCMCECVCEGWVPPICCEPPVSLQAGWEGLVGVARCYSERHMASASFSWHFPVSPHDIQRSIERFVRWMSADGSSLLHSSARTWRILKILKTWELWIFCCEDRLSSMTWN